MSTEQSGEFIGNLGFRQSRLGAVIVGLDAPRWTVLAVNDAYLAATHKTRPMLVGRGLLEEFPESDATEAQRGAQQVSASLAEAARGTANTLPVQRYDVRPEDGSEGFVERYWRLSSTPLCGEDGEIVGVQHEVENVTALHQAELARTALVALLAERNRELEANAQLLQANAMELEAQTEELQATASQLEERTEEAERVRRVAETAERQLLTVFAQTPAAMGVTMGAEHRFIVANRGYEILIGRPITLGQTFAECMPELVEQGYERLLTQVYQTGTPYLATEAFAKVDRGGVELEDGWFDFIYQPLVDGDNVVVGVLQQGIDVTRQVVARRETESARLEREHAFARLAESESQLRTLADAIPTLAWTARADGYIDWFNRRWYEYTGTKPAEMEGWGWQSVHPPENVSHVLDEWRLSIATGRPFEMVIPLRGRTGTFRRFLTRVTPARDADGRITRWFGTNTDVEALEEARAALERARVAAERANTAKSEFLAVMSHELRTPLNAIQGYAELMQMGLRGPLTDLQRQDLDRIHTSGVHLLGLINDVLNYTRVEGGSLRYDIDNVPLDEAMSTCEALIAPQMRAKALEFVVVHCDSAWTARGDRDKVRQIVLNLLTNAVKFTGANGRVELSCTLKDGVAELVVRDTGRGVAPDQAERIFEPFVQVDTRLTRTEDGVGLGLAISRDLARGMGGDLTMTSEVGVGSTFRLSLRS